MKSGLSRHLLFTSGVIAFFAIAVGAATQWRTPSAMSVGRIVITLNQEYGDWIESQLRDAGGFVAQSTASGAVRLEAEERLSMAMEEIRALNPAAFDSIMERSNIRIVPRQ